MNGGYDVGLLMGAYHIGRPDLNDNASLEAQYFIEIADDYLTTGYLRPVLDLEFGEELGWETLSNWVHDWMDTVQGEAGIQPIIYVSSYYAQNLDSSLSQYNL